MQSSGNLLNNQRMVTQSNSQGLYLYQPFQRSNVNPQLYQQPMGVYQVNRAQEGQHQISYSHPQVIQHSHQQLLTHHESSEAHSQKSGDAKNELQISEVLTRTRRKELESALKKTKSDSDVVIQSRLKRKISKSTRGSAFRGVSKNGKKWQVSAYLLFIFTLGLVARKFEEALYWLDKH